MYLILTILVSLMIAVLVVSVRHTSTPPPPPPALGSTECDWCNALRERVGFPVMPPVDVRMSQGIRSRMSAACTPLYQRDFANGTYLAETDGVCYELAEDIVFDPAPWADYRASAVAPYSAIAAFRLDFFAAFAVTAKDVMLDLNGFEMRQSDAHYLKQRFFALIEVSDRPFIRGQGPVDFSGSAPGTVVAAHRFSLINGKLGLSSHHGVHGNNPEQILICDVDIYDYEVAAVALNGARDVVMHGVRALGTSQRVPVLGTYSSARFTIPFAERLLAMVPTMGQPPAPISAAAAALISALADLRMRVAEAEQDILDLGLPTVDAISHPVSARLFANPSGLPDGSAGYGALLHMKGVAVGGFECDASSPQNDESSHLLIERSEFRNIRMHVKEVVSIEDTASGTLQRGPAGAIFRVDDLIDPSTGGYDGTALSDTEIAFANLRRLLGITEGSAAAGTSHIHASISAWAGGATTALASNISAGVLKTRRMGDDMGHTQKGAIGIRVSGGRHVCVERTIVSGIENVGENGKPRPLPGETAASAYYVDGTDGGNAAQGPNRGYLGADAYGIVVDAAADVLMLSTTVRGVHSRFMHANGVAVFNDAKRTRIHDMTIMNVSALTRPEDQDSIYSPKTPRAVGMYTATSADVPTITGFLEIDDIRAGRIGLASETIHEATGIEGCTPGPLNWYTA